MLDEYDFSKARRNKMTTTTTDKVQVGGSTTGTSTSTTWRCPCGLSKAEQGWECPRCGRINAPWKSQCDCDRNNYWTVTDSWIYKPYDDQWWKHVYCGQADDITKNPNIYTVGGSDYKTTSNTYVNVSGTQSNKIDPNTVTTAWNNGPSTQTIHNGKTNYKE